MQIMRKWSTLVFVLLVAAALRFWKIDAIPVGFHFDESFEGMEAWRILTDSSYRPIFLTGNFGVAPLNSYANAFMFAVVQFFGGEAGPTAMRLTAGCFGLITIVAVWGVTHELQRLGSTPSAAKRSTFSPSPVPLTYLPLFAAATLAIMRWHVHFSRIGIEPIIVPLVWAISTGLLLRGWRTGSRLSFALAGVAIAASMYSYQGAWILPLLMIPVAILLLLQDFRADSVRGLLLAGLVAALIFAPLAWFFAQNPELFLLRPAQLATVGSIDIGSTDIASTDSNQQSTWQQVVATAKMFGPFGSPGDLDPRRNLPGQAALDLWLAIP